MPDYHHVGRRDTYRVHVPTVERAPTELSVACFERDERGMLDRRLATRDGRRRRWRGDRLATGRRGQRRLIVWGRSAPGKSRKHGCHDGRSTHHVNLDRAAL